MSEPTIALVSASVLLFFFTAGDKETVIKKTPMDTADKAEESKESKRENGPETLNTLRESYFYYPEHISTFEKHLCKVKDEGFAIRVLF